MSVGNRAKFNKTLLLAKISLIIDFLLDVVYFCRYQLSNTDRMLYNMMPCILLLIFSFLFFSSGTCRTLGVVALIFWGFGKLSNIIRIVHIYSEYGVLASVSLLDILVLFLQIALALLFIAVGIWGVRHSRMPAVAAVILVATDIITVLIEKFPLSPTILLLSDIFFSLAIFLLWPLAAKRIWRQRHCRETNQSLEAALLQAKAQYESRQLTESAYCAIKAELLQRL